MMGNGKLKLNGETINFGQMDIKNVLGGESLSQLSLDGNTVGY